MVEVVETGLDFVGNLTGEVRLGKMAFDAGKLLVGGGMPAAVDVVHAVAGAADPGVAGGVKSDHRAGNKDRADKDTEDQQIGGGKA